MRRYLRSSLTISNSDASSPPQKSSSAPSIDPEELERIRKRQAGQAVTIEAFMEWKIKFEAEMLALKIAEHGPDKEKDDRPTGKQLFLSNRAGLEEALIAAGEQETSAQLAAAMTAATRRAGGGGAGEGEEGVAVKEDLFLEDCDDLDDLDDLLDDDDDDYDYEGSDREEDEEEDV
jgi:hypothetical protein